MKASERLERMQKRDQRERTLPRSVLAHAREYSVWSGLGAVVMGGVAISRGGGDAAIWAVGFGLACILLMLVARTP